MFSIQKVDRRYQMVDDKGVVLLWSTCPLTLWEKIKAGLPSKVCACGRVKAYKSKQCDSCVIAEFFG